MTISSKAHSHYACVVSESIHQQTVAILASTKRKSNTSLSRHSNLKPGKTINVSRRNNADVEFSACDSASETGDDGFLHSKEQRPALYAQEEPLGPPAKRPKVKSSEKDRQDVGRNPGSPFQLFSSSMRPKLRRQNPDLSSRELNKHLSHLWEGLTEEKRNHFVESFEKKCFLESQRNRGQEDHDVISDHDEAFLDSPLQSTKSSITCESVMDEIPSKGTNRLPRRESVVLLEPKQNTIDLSKYNSGVLESSTSVPLPNKVLPRKSSVDDFNDNPSDASRGMNHDLFFANDKPLQIYLAGNKRRIMALLCSIYGYIINYLNCRFRFTSFSV
jgi:hypothetical protein